MTFRVMSGAAALLAALVVAPFASAQDGGSDYSRIGPYLFVSGVFADGAGKQTLPRDVDPSGGISGGFGFRVVPLFAVELQGEWLDFDGLDQGSIATNAKIYALESLGLDLGIIQPYVIGTAGFGFNDTDGNNPGGHFRIGVGTDFYITPDIAIFYHAQYTGQGGDASDLTYVNYTLGGLWRF